MDHPDEMPEFFVGSPEELQSHMQDVYARQQMQMLDIKHKVQDMFSNMDPEHLATLRFLLHQIAQVGAPAATFYEGVAAATLEIKYNVCTTCGVDHAKEELEKMTAPPVDGEATPMPPAPVPVTHPSSGIDPLEGDTFVGTLARFNVALKDEQNPGGPVICLGCNVEYVNLGDRMREKPGPEGCASCIEKAKWG
jgi:hypothetical protein